MKTAIHIGINIEQYNEMTPRELQMYVDVFNEKQKQLHEMSITQAYLTAYWQRVKKIPSLREVLGQKKKEKSPEELLAVVKQLNERFGGTVST